MPDELPMWHVITREIWAQEISVRAATFKEAVEMVKDGDGEYGSMEYVSTMRSDMWDVWDQEYFNEYDVG